VLNADFLPFGLAFGRQNASLGDGSFERRWECDAVSNFDAVEHASSISPFLKIAVQAAAAAGEIIRDGSTKRHVVEQKAVGDLVSDIDREADQVACDLIRGHSDWPILSEELNAEQEVVDEMWIVDPLDGSGAFLMSGGPEFPSVLIALRQEAKTQIGVCYFPLTGDWYYAERGKAAWRNGKRLVCDSNLDLADIWVEMNQYGDAEMETEYFLALRNRLRSSAGARMVTSSFPHAGVAMRIASMQTPLLAAVHDNNPKSLKQGPWDIAATQLILEEAGGVFLNPDGQRTDPFVAEPIIVAASSDIAKEIIDLGAREQAAKP
jgi:myo-inositol-1(or 4)-monophosphatase